MRFLNRSDVHAIVPLHLRAGDGVCGRRACDRCRAPAAAQTKISIGKVVGGNGLHIPSYVADVAGIFKQEGLEARFVSLTGKAQVTAGMSGNLDFVPIPSGGAQAALNGAEIRYIVGQSMSSQWVFVTRGDITKVEDLKGKTIGYGRLGSADYDEGATYLARFFNLQVGKDYKVIAYPGRARAHSGAAQQGHRRDAWSRRRTPRRPSRWA